MTEPNAESLDLPSRSPDEIRRLTSDAIARANARIDAALPIGDPTFDALFGALDDAARTVAVAFGQGAFLKAVAPDPNVREAADAANDQIEKWRAAVAQREDLAAAIARFVALTDLAQLDSEEAAYVRRWQTDVRLAGGGLPPEQSAEVRRLTDRLIELATAFNAHLLENVHLELTPDDLDGVPAAVVATLKAGMARGTFDVPIDEAIFFAVIERGRQRDVRRRVNQGKLRRGMPANRDILDEATAIRRRLAHLLGYRSWLELRIENMAAPDAAMIERFIEDMRVRLEPAAHAELEAMRRLLVAEAGAPSDLVVEDWDWRYADSEQRGQLGAEPEALAAYFELEDVVRGLADLSEAMFGVRLVEHPERTGWHPDVRAFDLVDRDSGEVLARMFFDPYVREGKAGNPFMDTLHPGVRGPAGLERPPTLGLVISAPVPSDVPSLIALNDVDSLFHEYGHVLDLGLARARFTIHRPESWIQTDWIEGPSGFLGRWGRHPDVIARFARHHVTGEPIPPQLLEPLNHLESQNTALRMLRWLSMARVDLLLHGETPITTDEALRRGWPLRGTALPEGTCEPATFPHLLVGYDCATYGFVWATALSDDLMARFEREGMTSPALGMAYRRAILEAPWTEDPLVGHAAFVGRPWSTDALIERVERGGALARTGPAQAVRRTSRAPRARCRRPLPRGRSR
jgi:Zn-dependent oligopeptidase